MRKVWTAALLWLLASTGIAATEVRDVRVWRAPDHTRVVFDLSGPTAHKLIVLDSPHRIVVDLTNARLPGGFANLDLRDTPVMAVRSGIRDGHDLRVVFDMSAAVDPRSFALSANAQAGDRLVLDLYDRESPAPRAGRTEPTTPTAPTPAPTSTSPVASIAPAAPQAPDTPPAPAVAAVQAPAVTDAPVVTARSPSAVGGREIIVAIDAGHGGEDPGATGPNGLREKAVVLAIAKELEALLKADRGFKPTMIRTGDYYVSLKGRRDLARQRQADVFVSVHADAFRRREARGASVYALSTSGATSTAAAYLAQRENDADLIGGVKLSDKDNVLASVLTDLSMTSTLDTSLKLGDQMLRSMGGVARLHKTRVEQAGFAVLKSPDIPSILVETGFISNPQEAAQLGTRSYQRQIAQAIYRGLREWFSAHPPPGTLLAAQKHQGGQEYVISRGDTLSGIAERFSVSLADLKSHNSITDSRIVEGQRLTIPRS